MTKDQIKRAAELYILANTASMDCQGADTDEELEVLELAIKLARKRLRRRGISYGQVTSLPAIVSLARVDS